MCVPGRYCEEDVNECATLGNNLCKNGATCNNMYGTYVCYCDVGYEGHHCEIDTDDCDPGEQMVLNRTTFDSSNLIHTRMFLNCITNELICAKYVLSCIA